MTNQTKQLNGVPDIPGLERVEFRSFYSISALGLLPLGFIPIMAAWYTWQYLQEMRLFVLTVCAIMLIPLLWILWRALTDGYYWRTDADGIYQHSIIRRIHAKWSDVQSADMHYTILGSRYYGVNTSRGNIIVSSGAELSSYSTIIASMWQYLRRNGKADGFTPPGDAASLWCSIPDEVPQQMEWKCAKKANWALVIIISIMLAVITFAVVYNPEGFCIEGVFIVALSLLGLAFIALQTIRNMPAETYLIDSSSITANWKSHAFTLPWSSVKRALWRVDDKCGSMICLEGKDKSTRLSVPYDYKDDECSKFILSIIRNLRSIAIYLVIPEPLRSIAKPWVSDVDRIELTIPGTVSYGLSGMLVILALVMWFIPHSNRPQESADLVAAGLCSIISLGVAICAIRYRVIADHFGLHKTILFHTKVISWDNVAIYERIAGSSSSGRVITIRAKDQQGHILFQTSSAFSSIPEWDLFVSFVDIKLSHLLTSKNEKPWLARPWNPSE